MTQRIIIEPVPLQTHKTMDGAVAAAQSAANYWDEQISCLVGRQVSSYEFRCDRLFLLLSEGDALVIGADASGVWWCSADQAVSNSQQQFSSPVDLVFCSTEESESYTYPWVWRGLLDDLVGRNITSVQPSDGLLYLSTENHQDMTFMSTAVIGGTDQYLLFFCPDD